MTVPVRIVGDSPVRLWHLDSRTRIARQIAEAETLRQVDDGEPAQLWVDGGFLFEAATLTQLAERPGSELIDPGTDQVAALCLSEPVAQLEAAARDRLGARATPEIDLNRLTPADLSIFDGKLRRHSNPTLARLTIDNAEALEAMLYGASYKGVTDLVTKWLWPRPAKVGVRLCARLGLSPNVVTLFGAVLMVMALWAFAAGQYALGLAAGWFMTYLDTVDGKLARVRVQSSRLGHVLDHGMDIIHPPFWYLAWAYGLPDSSQLFAVHSLEVLMGWMFAGYIVGRIVEGLFHALGNCSLFAWRPFDAYFRLITGRRNPCMILLTLGLLIGRPDLGLLWVVYWTVISTAILCLRLGYAGWVRWRQGPLQSWLADGKGAAEQYPRAYQAFSQTRAAYAVAADVR